MYKLRRFQSFVSSSKKCTKLSIKFSECNIFPVNDTHIVDSIFSEEQIRAEKQF